MDQALIYLAQQWGTSPRTIRAQESYRTIFLSYDMAYRQQCRDRMVAVRIARDSDISELYGHWARASRDQKEKKQKHAGYQSFLQVLGGPDIIRKIKVRKTAQAFVDKLKRGKNA